MRPARVLIVDDNELNAQLASFVLEHAGFDVCCAADAAKAMERIVVYEPELIPMDIQMPGMDGLALTRLLKADLRTRDIVVVAFTAYAMKGDEAKFRAAGCDGYICKPIDVATFAEQIRVCLPQAVRAADPPSASQ